MKNYTLSDETKTLPWGTVLHRVVATTTFTLACGLTVNAGDIGGWIEKASNLSGNAWVSGDAQVYENAQVYGDALVFGNAQVRGNTKVSGDARVSGNALVSGDAKVSGEAWISGDAKVMNDGDYVVFKNDWSSDRYFTWTKSNDKWLVGCFYGTGDELIKKAYADSEDSGKHYEACVKSVKTL